MVKPRKSFNKRTIVTAAVVLLLAIVIPIAYFTHNSSTVLAAPSIIKDPNLKVETVVNGFSFPTSMAFIDSNNILVLEKGGQVRLVSNGVLQGKPVLQVPVNTESERGLLGIAIMNSSNPSNPNNDTSTNKNKNNNNNKFVFLYYTESNGGTDLRNRVYKYTWDEQNRSLINPVLMLDLPALPGPNHDGGKLVIGPDRYLYAVIGDLNHRGQLQNIKDGPAPLDDTSVILRVNPNDGSPAMDNPFINDPSAAMHKYYAYGIRNSFGLAFDPVTRYLWQTENGPDAYDEINVVKPGFNSGWIKVMGPLSRNEITTTTSTTTSSEIDNSQLVNFPGSHYADPVFSWKNPVAVTAIEFIKSPALGEKYKNNIFVGDYNNGNLYYFEVNSTRTGIKPDINQEKAGLSNLIVDDDNQLSAVTFGNGFGAISDIKTGPKDGFLYVLSINDGSIYRIEPSSQSISTTNTKNR